MGAFDNYRPEHQPRVSKGDYWVEIIDAKEDQTKKNHDDMIVIQVRLNKVNLRVRDYLVSTTEFFNAKLTSLMECFGIPTDNEQLRSWIGAIGVVRLTEDGEYMRISRYFHPQSEEAKRVGPWDGPIPNRMTVSSLPERSDAASPEDDDDGSLPF